MTATEWKHLAGFLMLAVPAVMVLTHLVSWIIGRLRPKPATVGQGLPVKRGYESLEEFRKDAEELSVDDLLERCDGLGAPANPALEERKRSMKKAPAPAPAAERPGSGRPGGWYRCLQGPLVVLLDEECAEGSGRFIFRGDAPAAVLPWSSVGFARPVPGEWWVTRKCAEHGGDGRAFLVAEAMVALADNENVAKWVACGCLAPLNFGKGPVGGPFGGPTLFPWPIIKAGMSDGPAPDCPDCRGRGTVPVGISVWETCTTCKGSGLKAQPSASAGR